MKKTAVLIPAYKPDDRLPAYVSALLEAGISRVVTVDDGGGETYDAIFNKLAATENVDVIRYTPNNGKGYALRTGLRHIQENIPDAEIIITADADGQHKVADVLRMVEDQEKAGSGLLLGSRDFSQKNVPAKSRFGNRTTTIVFRVLFGQWISDTQTGLRAFNRDLLPMMIDVKGNRYEYEMNVLIACAEKKIPVRPLVIETVYENNNECSHFRPFRDSARIYKVILEGFFKFVAGSLLSFLVDYLLFMVLTMVLEKNVPALNGTFRFLFFKMVKRIAIATVAARICSGLFNYCFNRKITFRSDNHLAKSFFRYLAVFLANMILSAGIVSGLHLLTGAAEELLKIPVDLVLFFLNYFIQKRWVFREDKKKASGEA